MSLEMPSPRQVNVQTLVGLFVVVAGLLLMGDNLGWFEAGRALSFWPLAVLAIGILMLKRAVDPPGRVRAGFVTFVGVWLTASNVLDWPLRFSMIWPVGLVVLGVTIIQRAMGQQRLAPGTTDQGISDFAFWSGVERRVTSSLFRRADLTAVMGGIELDFRQAAINGEAVIDLFVVMGGVEIKVPPDWAVSNQMVAIMGGAQDKSTGTSDSKHRLVLRGFVMMGGVEVKT